MLLLLHFEKMQVLYSLNLYPENKKAMIHVAVRIESGNVASFPTDTVYALSCNANNLDAVRRIYELKNRDKNKPLQIFVENIEKAEEIAVFDDISKKLVKAFWPGALTLVLHLKEDAKIVLKAPDGTVAIRIPDCETVLEIIRVSGVPLAATSANISGNPPLNDPDEINEEFKGQVEYIMDNEQSKKNPSKGISTIVKVTDGKPEILRKGSISEKEIYDVLDVS